MTYLAKNAFNLLLISTFTIQWTVIMCTVDTVQTRGYILTAPSVFDSNSTETICLTLHGISSNGQIEVKLISSASNELIARTTQKIIEGASKCFELKLPHTSQLEATLLVNGSFDGDDYLINGTKVVKIRQTADLSFIQTDKPIYKPGQNVQFRVLRVTPGFLPSDKVIRSIWIENPSQVRLSQWILPSSDNGITDLNFQLSEEPQLGTWTIYVEDLIKNKIKQTFKVEEYVLPKFSVHITSPSVVLSTFKEFTWKVCAHYTYGEPVVGKVKVNVSMTTRYNEHERKPPVFSEEDDFQECRTMTVKKPEWSSEQGSGALKLYAEVTEHGTETMMSDLKQIQIKTVPLKLSILTKHYFKPGIHYFGKVKAETGAGLPAANENLDVELSGYDEEENRSYQSTIKSMTDDQGIAEFVISPQSITIQKINLRIVATGYQTKYCNRLRSPPYNPWSSGRRSSSWSRNTSPCLIQPILYQSLKSWYSPSNSYIQIEKIDHSLKCNEEHNLTIRFTRLNQYEGVYGNLTVFYQMMARNDALIKRNVVVSIYDGWAIASNDSFYISIRIKPKMSPIVKVLAYYIRDDGEIVSDSETLTVDECFANEVQLKFEEDKVLPGAPASLHLSADINSLCAIGFTDKSVQLLSGQGFGSHKVFSILNEQPPNQPAVSPQPKCPSHEYGDYNINTNLIGSDFAFETIGMMTITDLVLNKNPCRLRPRPYWMYLKQYSSPVTLSMSTHSLPELVPSFARSSSIGSPRNGRRGGGHQLSPKRAPPREMTVDQTETSLPVVEIRDHFPETWLWQLLRIGENGQLSVQREIPHTITEWTGNTFCMSSHTGLGMSSQTSIKAFQPFFISYTMPYSVKNGETIPLTISIFNYLSGCFPMAVTLEPSKAFKIISNSTEVKLCLCGRKSHSHKYYIQPLEIGNMNITVRAHSIPLTNSFLCQNETALSNVVAYDAVTKSLLVKAQGFPHETTQSNWICTEDYPDESKKTEYMLELPFDVIKGSARATLSVTGDLMGPTISGLEHLVRLPTGCGEQNMVNFVPNIHVFNYLNITQQMTETIKIKAISHLKHGYQRELNYKRSDGSYSAFGMSDKEGSIWLTAFVVKSFAQAQSIIYIDSQQIQAGINFIIKNQLENGCFRPSGQVFHKGLQGGVGHDKTSSTLTLYITVALLEAGFDPSNKVIKRAFECLENDTQSNLYQLSMKAYALVLANNRTAATTVLKELERRAIRQENLVYWSDSQSHSNAIETTSYVLLAVATLNDIENKEMIVGVVRWLAKQRNAYGGYDSTQDTVLALQALAKYVSQLSKQPANLTIAIEANDMEDVIYVNDENRLLMQTRAVSLLPNMVDVEVAGEGCALIQVTVRYNTPESRPSPVFYLEVNVVPYDLETYSYAKQTIEICTRYQGPDGKSNMAIVEIQMVTGYEADSATLEMMKMTNSELKRWEMDNDGTVELYFDELIMELNCINITVIERMEVENRKPATIKVYDYYQPEQSTSKEYSLLKLPTN